MPLMKFEGPDGPEALEFPLGDNGLPRLMLSEVAHIQRVADMTIPELVEGMGRLDPTALAAAVQVMWKRQGRIVRFEDVDFDISTLAFDSLPNEVDDEEAGAVDDDVPAGAPDPTAASSGDATAED